MTDARFLESKTEVFWPDSSLVEEVLYNRETQELAVLFHRTDDYYVYPAVPAEVANAFRDANSAGAFYNTYIKAYGPGEVVSADLIGFECDCKDDVEDEVEETMPYSGPNDVQVGDLVRVLDTDYARSSPLSVLPHVGQDFEVIEVTDTGYARLRMPTGNYLFRHDEIVLVRANDADDTDAIDFDEVHAVLTQVVAEVADALASVVELVEILRKAAK